ncbi:PREDICTED: serine/threonine-protein kinase STY46-like [Lupinus angustifolius]|uniref:serine/threonine-protein kinase STY46-like n=1 Tax=Lupinus angustifolius TaxID=3871 RepID=UPI00092EEC3F|nr:PREDICTED: serine/threonine-protein kinase STY46-like [Lupinus angustifolius]
MSSSGGESSTSDKQKEKARVSRTSLILWHAHQNDAASVRKLLQEDPSLVNARDYDNRTPLHVASLHGWLDVANCLIEFGADVNAQDRWKNTPLADAEGAKRNSMIQLLKTHGGSSYGQNGSHFEPNTVPPPLPNKCDWEVDPTELDFSNSARIGKGSFGEILKAHWRGTPVAVKRILPSLSEDRLVIQDFRHEVNLLVKLRHPNIVQFLGAVTDRKPLMLITEYLRGGDLHQYLKEKGSLNAATAINFSMDIARGMAYLHNEPNVIIHRDLKPRNVLLVNSSADHLKVGDFGLSKLIKVQSSHDVYRMTGETGSYRYMAPEVFKHRRYDKKVDVFSFAMILYEMLEGEPPFANLEPYEGAKRAAEGHRPTIREKGYTPELIELTEQCWAADMNQRPSFIDILKRLEKIKGNLPSDHHWHLFSS